MQEVSLRTVGIVRTSASDDDVRTRKPDVKSTVEIFPEFEDALEGLDGFSHIFVVGYFHRLRSEQIGPLKVKPRGLLHEGFKLEELPLIGVFALDSPTRPNPIGLSLARLIKREGTRLEVANLDFFDGTPVLDIKPYQVGYRVDRYETPQWHTKLVQRVGHV